MFSFAYFLRFKTWIIFLRAIHLYLCWGRNSKPPPYPPPPVNALVISGPNILLPVFLLRFHPGDGEGGVFSPPLIDFFKKNYYMYRTFRVVTANCFDIQLSYPIPISLHHSRLNTQFNLWIVPNWTFIFICTNLNARPQERQSWSLS